MNKVYKVIWSKAKNCYIAVSEIAKSRTKSPSAGVVGAISLENKVAMDLNRGFVAGAFSLDNPVFLSSRISDDFKITVAAIVKNEAENVPQWVQAARSCADEIVVVDTGSSDSTVERFADYGINCFHYDWHDDFASAKNYMISLCHGDWIVLLDGDEWFRDGCDVRKAIAKHHKNPVEKAIIADWICLDKDRNNTVMFSGGAVRAFRNSPEIRYFRKVHENLTINYENFVFEPDFKMYHTGYSGSVNRSKHERNLRIMRTMFDFDNGKVEYPTDWRYIEDTYAGLGQFDKALWAADKMISYGVQDYSAAAWVTKFNVLFAMKTSIEEMRKQFAFCFATVPSVSGFRFLASIYYLRHGLFDEGLDNYIEGLRMLMGPQDKVAMEHTYWRMYLPEATALAASYYLQHGQLEAALLACSVCEQYCGKSNWVDPVFADIRRQLRIFGKNDSVGFGLKVLPLLESAKKGIAVAAMATGLVIGVLNTPNPVSAACVIGGCCNTANATYSVVVSGKDNTTINYTCNNAVIAGCGNKVGGDYALGAAGACNTVGGYYSAIISGQCNSTGACYNLVASGYCNFASADYSGIFGGRYNQTLGNYSVVVGGSNNSACYTNSSVFGGSSNNAYGYGSTVLGGSESNAYASSSIAIGGGITGLSSCSDTARGSIAIGKCATTTNNFEVAIGSACAPVKIDGTLTVDGAKTVTDGTTTKSWTELLNAGGGSPCFADGVVLAGCTNTASVCYSSVSGGYCNKASCDYSSVSGGWQNTASGCASSVSGGWGNEASGGIASSVSGGYANKAIGGCSSVSGGEWNTASCHSSSVSGGCHNTASDIASSVSGGEYNEASGQLSSVSGGCHNTASNTDSSVSGGECNIASGWASSVSGGCNNIASCWASSVSGGCGNTASGSCSSVSGGICNTATDNASSVSGGMYNTASGSSSSVTGGRENIASSQASSVTGGRCNTANAFASSVSGGCSNTASGYVSWVAGGCNGIAYAQYSSVIGGGITGNVSCSETALGSVAIGNCAITTQDYEIAIGSACAPVKIDGSLTVDGAKTVTDGTNTKTWSDLLNSSTVVPYFGINTALGESNEDGSGASGTDSIAIGKASSVTGNQSISIGVGNQVNGSNSGAFGDPSVIDGINSYSVGNNNTIATGTCDVFVLGNNVNATNSNTVILGSCSTATADNVVSVGREEIKNGDTVTQSAIRRRIINVANGVNDNDVVTLGQLNDKTKYYGVNFADSSGEVNTNFDGSGAVGINSIAIGKLAKSGTAPSDVFGVSVGYSANSTYNSVALGSCATAAGNSVSLGADTFALGSQGVAIGYCSAVSANATRGIAIGYSAKANDSDAISLGYNASADIGGIAIGQETVANNNGNGFATVIGSYAKGNGYDATVYGSNAKVTGGDSVAVGAGAQSLSSNSVAIGDDAHALEAYSTVVGNGVYGLSQQSTALGALAYANGNNSIAIGYCAYTSSANSIAIGSCSMADTSGTVSFGRPEVKTGETVVQSEIRRRLINVADGINDSDVATVGQLNSSVSTILNNIPSPCFEQGVVLAGCGNSVTPSYTAISGGACNFANCNFASISGGSCNTAGCWAYFYEPGGNRKKTIKYLSPNDPGIVNGTVSYGYPVTVQSGQYASVSGGDFNFALGNYSSILGGHRNSALGDYATIGTGQNNVALNDYSSVISGCNNTSDGDYSVVITGTCNSTGKAFFYYDDNEATHLIPYTCSKVSNGYIDIYNTGRYPVEEIDSGDHSVVITGDTNTATARNSVVVTGYMNVAGYDSVIVSGEHNNASNCSAVVGGNNNTASGNESVIVGGQANVAEGSDSVISGGCCNFIDFAHYSSTITGGCHNSILSDDNGHFINSGSIVGGSWNSIQYLGSYSSILGGSGNTAYCDHGTVVGGGGNSSQGDYSTVVGGSGNIAGDCNFYCEGFYVTVVGGQCNVAKGDHASIFGGNSNVVAGCHAVVLGGCNNKSGEAYVYTNDRGVLSYVQGFNDNLYYGELGDFSGNIYHYKGKEYPTTQYGGTGAAAVGGQCNVSIGNYSVVSGGQCNRAFGDVSTVNGGVCNFVSSSKSTISGGSCNTIRDQYYYTDLDDKVVFIQPNDSKLDLHNYIYTDADGLEYDISWIETTGAVISGGTKNIAIGNHSVVSSGECNFASGCSSWAAGGKDGKAYAAYSTAIGGGIAGSDSDFDLATGSVAIGKNAVTTRNYEVSIGSASAPVKLGGNLTVNSADSVTDGVSTKTWTQLLNPADGVSYVGINSASGSPNQDGAGAVGQDAIALGNAAKAAVLNSVALGKSARSSGQNSLALGSSSVAADDNVVSFGHLANDLDASDVAYGSVQTRRLVNVSDGVANSDVATVGQLRASTAALDNAVLYDSADKLRITVGNSSGATLTNLNQGVVSATSKDAVTGAQLYATNQNIAGFAADINRNKQSIRDMNASVSSALESVSSASTLVDTINTLKADASLNNLTEAGRQIIATAAANAVQEYMAANSNTTSSNAAPPMAPMLMSSNPNTLNVTDAGNGSLHVGQGNSVNGTSSIAIGVGNQVNANNSGAFGDPSVINADESYVLGNDDTINEGATGSFIVGNDSVSDAKGGLSLGSNNTLDSTAENSVLLGNNASAKGKNSVALGSGSVVNDYNTVSVGNDSLKRKITNVMNGVVSANSSDAVTGSQLYLTNEKIAKLENTVDKKANADASDIDVDKWSAALGVGKVEAGNTGLVQGGAVYDAIATNRNDMVTYDSLNNSIRLASNAKYDKVDTIDVSTSAGDTRVITGIKTNPQDNTSAANVGYVKAVNQMVVDSVTGALERSNQKMERIGANAAAMSALTPASFEGDERWSLAASVGNYRSETAGAVGAFYKPVENVMMNVRGSFGNDENMVAAGVAVSLNKGDIPGVTKRQLAKTVNVQAGQIQQQADEIHQLRGTVHDITQSYEARFEVMNDQIAKLTETIQQLKAKTNA